jgi:hypothetical protein
MNSDELTDFKIRPRFSAKTGGNYSLKSIDLRIFDRNRNATSSDYAEHARGDENR